MELKIECLVLKILIIIFLFLFGLVFLLGNIITTEESLLIYPDVISKFSVPCDDISLSPDEDADNLEYKEGGLNIVIDKEGQYICSESNFTHLFNMVFERQSRLRTGNGLDETQYLRCGNEQLKSKPGYMSAFFSKLSAPKSFSDDGDDVILRWDNHDKYSVIDRSVKYNDGKITITEGRTYFIYASVHFNISQRVQESDKYHRKVRQLSLRLCKNRNGYEQTVTGKTELFDITSNNIVSSLRIGGHFTLYRNDSLYIKVSNAKILIHNSKGNSFGLFPT